MFKYLLIAFSSLFIISCSTDTIEEDLVETNENLFPKGYFSNRYFDDNNTDSVQIIYDEQNRPIEKRVRYLYYLIDEQKVNYINDSEYEILVGGNVIETGTYQLKTFFSQKIIQKLTSEKGGVSSKFDYQPIDGDTVLTSVQEFQDDALIAEEFYVWDRNAKYPHLTNLKSIERRDNLNEIKIITAFEYDEYQNPFVRLGIFDDVNYRHLSFNNYTKKTITMFDKDNVKVFEIGYNSDFKYKNGKVDLTK